jgi:hypothetical protein
LFLVLCVVVLVLVFGALQVYPHPIKEFDPPPALLPTSKERYKKRLTREGEMW